ncbi:MAG: hypothetical protein QXW84_08040 [Archaeoglobaceae archaeon]
MESIIPTYARDIDFTAGIRTGKIIGKIIARRSISLLFEFVDKGARIVITPEIGIIAINMTPKVKRNSPSR